ncbi:MAG: enoyl-CoA hydratase-related protein [Acidimicrobiales bacterium]
MALVETDLDGGVLTVTLNDTERRNALSRDLVSDLVATLDDADADDAVRVVILTNAGTVFCAGANLSEQSGRSDGGQSAGRTVGMAEVFSRFRTSPKPSVGRIAGHCVAGGMGLAAAMDISIGVEDATFGFTEVRIGMAPAMISVLCLPKMREADARCVPPGQPVLGRRGRPPRADHAGGARCGARRCGRRRRRRPAPRRSRRHRGVEAPPRRGPRHGGRRRVRLDPAALRRAVHQRGGEGGHGRLPREAAPELGPAGVASLCLQVADWHRAPDDDCASGRGDAPAARRARIGVGGVAPGHRA